MKSGTDRVLDQLRRGTTCQVDWYAPHVVDGGKPITRLAARINELREQGHRIMVVGRKHKCAVYELMPPAPVEVAPVLFDPALGSVPAGPYDDIDVAA